MPKRPSPLSLKQCVLNVVALHCESICYGLTKGSKELARFIHTEGFAEVPGPFVDWPNSLLQELVDTVYAKRYLLLNRRAKASEGESKEYFILVLFTSHHATKK